MAAPGSRSSDLRKVAIFLVLSANSENVYLRRPSGPLGDYLLGPEQMLYPPQYMLEGQLVVLGSVYQFKGAISPGSVF